MVANVVVRSIDFLLTDADNPAIKTCVTQDLLESDFIFVQPGGQGIFNAANIKQQYTNKTIIIAGLYFRGLQPNCCYIGNYEDRFQTPSLYHSVAVLDAFLQGKSEKYALNAFSFDNFQRLGLMAAWDSSVDEMRQRDGSVDVPAADLIENYCHEFYGFLSINHPILALLHQYVSGMLRYAGVPYHAMNLATAKDPLIAQDVFPLHDFVAEYYELPYRTSQHWMIYHLGRKYITRQDYVHRCYVEYRKSDIKKLTIHSPADLLREIASNDKLKHLYPR